MSALSPPLPLPPLTPPWRCHSDGDPRGEELPCDNGAGPLPPRGHGHGWGGGGHGHEWGGGCAAVFPRGEVAVGAWGGSGSCKEEGGGKEPTRDRHEWVWEGDGGGV